MKFVFSLMQVTSVGYIINIRFNSVHPGFTETSMTKDLIVNEVSYMAGSRLVIDGGYTAQ